MSESEPAGGPFSCASDAGVLTWPDASQSLYWIYKSTDGGMTYRWLGQTVGELTFTDPQPEVGARYQVHYSGIPQVECAITNEPVEAMPFGCTNTDGVLTWTDDAQSLYWVYKSTDGGMTYSWIGRTTGATTFTDPQLAAGAVYQVHYADIPRTNCTNEAG